MASRLVHLIFVYGTLKKGQPNYFRLQDSKFGVASFLGEAKLAKKYPMVIASKYNIPFLLAKEGDGKVSTPCWKISREYVVVTLKCQCPP